MKKTIDFDAFLINLFFGKIIRKFREWKIKRYKAKKVKAEAKNSAEKIYKMHFRLAIRDKDGLIKCDSIFNIEIPANGYFYAKKKLERYVVGNIDIDVVDFEALEEGDKSWKEEITTQSESTSTQHS